LTAKRTSTLPVVFYTPQITNEYRHDIQNGSPNEETVTIFLSYSTALRW